ncbi:MAG: 3-deoxy-D-manno-octulosonic acid kinase [Gammaproteobacteria bacterium]|nr:3-deoxy-D-manno-octulosonic acid kinase [Gammaproteobacteria bacterium]
MDARLRKMADGWLLFDADILPDVEASLFSQAVSSSQQSGKKAPGRGDAWFFATPAGEMVLRHYRRGGLAGKVYGDRYWRLPLQNDPQACRPWQEWQLLQQLLALGLPVPQPVAVRLQWDGLFYRGDLVMRRLPGVTLADRLQQQPLTLAKWQEIGALIARFHLAGLDHSDLNARNLLAGEGAAVALIDFDRCRLRPVAASWRQANLARLLRSLRKFKRTSPFYFAEKHDWAALLSGYEGQMATDVNPQQGQPDASDVK